MLPEALPSGKCSTRTLQTEPAPRVRTAELALSLQWWHLVPQSRALGGVFTCVRVIQDCWFCLPHSEINRSFSIEIICLRKENNKWRDSKILGDCHERRFVPSLGLLSRVRKRTESTALKAQRNSANQTSSFLFGFPLPKHWRL